MEVAKTFEEFNQRLKNHEAETGTKFVFYQGPKTFTNGEISSKFQLHWDESTPYLHFGTRTYICHQGKDINTYQKKKYAQLRKSKTETGHRRYNLTKGTKKLNCPARIKVTRMIRMPEYQLTGPVTPKRKCNISCQIKAKLTEEGQVSGDEVYLFNLPELSEHKNHVLDIDVIITEPNDLIAINEVEVESEKDPVQK